MLTPLANYFYHLKFSWLRGRGVKQDKRLGIGARRALALTLIITELLKLCKSDRGITGTWVKWDNALRSIRLAMIKGAEIVAR